MKIAQICFSGLGGHSGVVFPLISADLSKQHEWFIGFVGNTPILKDFYKKCDDLNIQHAKFYFYSGLPFIQWIRLFYWLKKISPNSIICHNPTFILPCKLYSWLYACRLINVEHTNNSLKRIREWIFTYLSFLLANSVVVLTLEYKNELKKFIFKNFQEKKIFVISNGIDVNQFPLIDKINGNAISNNSFNIGMAARFTETKMQELLVIMLKKIRESDTKFQIYLYFAGDGPNLKKVKDIVKEEGLEDFVTFDGLLNENDLANWYQKLDIYAHASSGETLSISLLQAMSCGLPIVASDVDGITNLLKQDQEYGYCVSNDSLLFADTVINICKNPFQAKEMGLKASNLVKEKYSHTNMLEKYLSLL